MLGEFIEASINFTNSDIWMMYGIMAVGCYLIAILMYKASLKDD